MAFPAELKERRREKPGTEDVCVSIHSDIECTGSI